MLQIPQKNVICNKYNRVITHFAVGSFSRTVALQISNSIKKQWKCLTNGKELFDFFDKNHESLFSQMSRTWLRRDDD